MAESIVVEVNLDIARVDESELAVVDSSKTYLFVFKKGRRGLTLAVSVRGRKPVSCRLGRLPETEEERERLKERIRQCLEGVDDEGVRSAADQFADALTKLYTEWEERLEDLELAERIKQIWRETPLATVQTSTGPIEVLESDGYTVGLRGGVVPPPSALSRDKFAVVETTYVLARKPVLTKNGLEERTGVFPLFIIAEYEGGKLKGVRVEDPDAGVIRVLEDTPVRVEIRSKAKNALPTLLDFAAVKPWIEGAGGEPPSFAETYLEVVSELKRYVCYSWDERLYHLNASYIVYTYFSDFFTVAPRLFFLGPYGTGKTRAMLTTVVMSWHGFAVLDPSEASTFRSIEAFGLTLGIDESALSGELEKLIAASYKRGTKVPRVDKAARETFELSFFDPFAPVVLAFTDPPSELVTQRTIVVNMLKCDDPNPAREDPDPFQFKELRSKLYLLRLLRAGDFVKAMDEVRERVKGVLKGRHYEVWYPLLVAAYLGGEEAFCSVLSLALEDAERRGATLYSEEKLVIAALEEVLGEDDEAAFMAKDLAQHIHMILINFEGYTEKQAKAAWSPQKVGRVLSRMGLTPRSRRTEEGPRYVYTISRQKLEELKSKYGYVGDQYDGFSDLLKSLGCSRCSGCSRFSGEVGSGGPDGEGNTASIESPEPNLPEKPTTSTTSTTLETSSTTLEQLLPPGGRSKRELGVLDAIVEIVKRAGRISDVEIYRELVRMRDRRELPVGVDVIWDNVREWLRMLEERGVLARVFDENLGQELYVLREGGGDDAAGS
jgi:hypothetical protein